MDNNKARLIAIYSCSLCVAIILTIAITYIPNPYLWFDEAGQFWMSKGLNHFSEPYSVCKCVDSVIANNGLYNLDPGGFTLLLHYWMQISNHWIYLRLLPFFFSLGFVYFGYRISKCYSGDSIIAFCVAVLPLILPVFTNRIAELRAYSMEMCGVMCSVWLLTKNSKQLTYRQLILMSFLQIVFCTSRYGYIIVALCVSIRVLLLLFNQNSLLGFVKKSIVYGLPLLSAVIYIYIEMLKNHNGTDANIDYVGYILHTPGLLLHPFSLLFYLTLIHLVLSVYHKKIISEFLILTVSVCSVYFILSAIGIYPWDIHRTISAFCLLVLYWINYMAKYIHAKKQTISRQIIAGGITIIFALFLILFQKIHSNSTENQFVEYENFVSRNRFEKMYVNYHANTMLRYQYEYGKYKNRAKEDGYPQKFVLEKDYYKTDGELAIKNFDVYWSDGIFTPSKSYRLINGYSNFYQPF